MVRNLCKHLIVSVPVTRLETGGCGIPLIIIIHFLLLHSNLAGSQQMWPHNINWQAMGWRSVPEKVTCTLLHIPDKFIGSYF
jgi:hypothetical protein